MSDPVARIPHAREARLATELVPEQVLPKVLTTSGLVSIYVFIIYFVTGSSIMSTAGWAALPMWVLGFLVFLVPAGLAVVELGNLWPAQGGVYVWAYRTMNEPLAFFGGFLSWVPVILNGATTPAAILAFLSLATGAEFGLTTSILLQLVLLWVAVALALRRLVVTQRMMHVFAGVYAAICLAVLAVGLAHAATEGAAVPVDRDALLSFDFAGYGWVFGLVLLYLLGVETPFNMGAEFLSVRSSAARMVGIGSLVLAVGYVITTAGILLSTPLEEIDSVTGVIGALGAAGIPGLVPVAAVALSAVMLMALTTYQSAYARLIFVSGLERHLPRLFTHLNPRTRNPVTAVLVQGCISSTMIVVLYSRASLVDVFLYLQGALTVIWLASGFFFFYPLARARWKYAERYATEDFWRIPGGRAVAVLVAVVGSAATAVGMWYAFTLPFSDSITQRDWMLNVGLLTAAFLASAALVYVLGRRSAAKLSREDSLAHLAVLDLPGAADGGAPAAAAPASPTGTTPPA